MKQTRTVVLIVLGLVFVALGVYYFVTPAMSLPHFVPGYEAGVTAHHIKHALAAVILALGCAALLWFTTGRKSSPTPPANDAA